MEVTREGSLELSDGGNNESQAKYSNSAAPHSVCLQQGAHQRHMQSVDSARQQLHNSIFC